MLRNQAEGHLLSNYTCVRRGIYCTVATTVDTQVLKNLSNFFKFLQILTNSYNFFKISVKIYHYSALKSTPRCAAGQTRHLSSCLFWIPLDILNQAIDRLD